LEALGLGQGRLELPELLLLLAHLSRQVLVVVGHG
jgi:hypothetical protein